MWFAISVYSPRWEHFVAVFDVITERKQAEEQIKKLNENLMAQVEQVEVANRELNRALTELTRSNQELQEFAYVASHDLQEPLRKIANFSEMLAKKYQGHFDARADRYFGYVSDGAKRMQALINDLLGYSRVGTADFRLIPASLEEVLKEALTDMQTLIRESGARISHDPLPTLRINPLQMRRLLQNLISNGIKFHDGHPPQVHIAASREPGDWLIAVRDNGIGFAPRHAEEIFKVFRRLHTKEAYPGTGIGLAICKKIVERHGGRIWAESTPGQGSTFYFTIPA
jgi:light-regulated signal transduction histidine kinase (bacteriophytochrome)